MANIIFVEFMQGAQSLVDGKNTKVPIKQRKAPNNNSLQEREIVYARLVFESDNPLI